MDLTYITLLYCIYICTELGGNQRELARQKNAKKQQELAKGKGAAEKGGNKGLSLEARKHRYV